MPNPKKEPIMGRAPGPGAQWNPIEKVMRKQVNKACICGSGKKYKKCCRLYMPSILPIEEVAKLRKKGA